jgi:hypothetical protein
MRGLFSMVTGGGKLSDGQRGELLGIINNRETQARQAYDAKRSTYSGILKQRGIDPSMVFSEPMATGMQGGQQPVQQPAQQGGMSAPSGFSAPAPSRAGTPDDGYAQARALAQARPDKIPKIRAWLQQQGLDPSRL